MCGCKESKLGSVEGFNRFSHTDSPLRPLSPGVPLGVQKGEDLHEELSYENRRIAQPSSALCSSAIHGKSVVGRH